MKNWLMIMWGAIGGFISAAFGSWDASLTTLVIFMGIDFLTGTIQAMVFHKSKKSKSGTLTSKACFMGLTRKGLMLAMILMGARLDILIGQSFVRDALCVAFIVNEAISIIENAGSMGVPVPDVLMKAIEILNGKEEK